MNTQHQGDYSAANVRSLPGGGEEYFNTLLQILQWVNDHPGVDSEDLYAWIQSNYTLETSGETGRPGDYTRFVASMGYIQMLHGLVALTESGQRLLRTRDQAIVLDQLMRGFRGVYDVLASVAKAGAATTKAVRCDLQGSYGWTDNRQYQIRLDWLRCLGSLQKIANEYALTPEGRQRLVEFAGKSHL